MYMYMYIYMYKVKYMYIPVGRFRGSCVYTLLQCYEGVVSCQFGPSHFDHGLGALLLRALSTD